MFPLLSSPTVLIGVGNTDVQWTSAFWCTLITTGFQSRHFEFQPVSSDGFHSRNFWAPSHLFHQCLFSHLQHLETDLGCRRTWAAEEPIFLLSLANSAFQDVALPLIYGLTGIVLVHSPALVKCSGENFLETRSSWCTVGDPSREKGSRGRHVSKSQLWNAIVWWPRVVDLPAHSVLV